MALRVLLADESPTIKKVMQISLQDFDVELKTVQLGIDVFQVAEQFQPNIIFCDVLLQKKNGYEVSQELKSHPKTKEIPIILMWSGFMELDDEKFRQCGADGQLEKPFDANALRTVVKNLVKETSDQAISNFLEFPDVTRMATAVQPAPEAQATPAEPQGAEQSKAGWNMDSFEDIKPLSEFEVSDNQVEDDVDEFAQKPLQPIKPVVVPTAKPTITPLKENFAEKVARQRPSGPQGLTADIPEVDTSELDNISHSELLSNVSMQQEDLDKFKIKPQPIQEPVKPPPVITVKGEMAQLTQEQLELLIKTQSKEVIERVVWKLVPEIAEKLVKEEIQRLLDDPKL